MVTAAEAQAALDTLMNETLSQSALRNMNFSLSGARRAGRWCEARQGAPRFGPWTFRPWALASDRAAPQCPNGSVCRRKKLLAGMMPIGRRGREIERN
jgi:hypothetical protein